MGQPGISKQAEATRLRIVQAATEVFGARGYSKGSLVEIAEKVGMTHAGVLHHFGSKEQLLLEVLGYRDQTDIDDYDGHRRPTGAGFLRHLVKTVRLNEARAGIVQAYAVLSADSVTEGHPAQAYFRERTAQLRAQLVDAYAAVAPDGCPRRRLEEAASATIAVMDGLQVQWLLDPSVKMPPAVQATIEGLIAWLDGAAEPLP